MGYSCNIKKALGQKRQIRVSKFDPENKGIRDLKLKMPTNFIVKRTNKIPDRRQWFGNTCILSDCGNSKNGDIVYGIPYTPKEVICTRTESVKFLRICID